MTEHSQERQADASAQAEGAIALKELLIYASSNGVTYDSLRAQLDPSHNWSGNSLRQFVHRKGSPRVTAKIRALADVMTTLFETEPGLAAPPEKVKRALTKVAAIAQDTAPFYGHTELSSRVGQIFRKIRRKSAGYELPERFAFVRYGRDGKYIITVLVDTCKTDSGYVFSMKIMGTMKRIVIGDVSFTTMNHYFQGAAYTVRRNLGEQAFSDLDVFDLNRLEDVISANEDGIESFAVSNADMAFPLSAATFLGLDGRGNPVSGVAALISEDLFVPYGIDPEMVISKVECARRNPKLTQALEFVKARTHTPPEGGAMGYQEEVMKLMDGPAGK